MNKLYAHILFIIFIGFIASISVNYAGYLTFLNGGAAIEDVNTMPEENHENELAAENAKTFCAFAEFQRLTYHENAGKQTPNPLFSLQENNFFDVLSSPPEGTI